MFEKKTCPEEGGSSTKLQFTIRDLYRYWIDPFWSVFFHKKWSRKTLCRAKETF